MECQRARIGFRKSSNVLLPHIANVDLRVAFAERGEIFHHPKTHCEDRTISRYSLESPESIGFRRAPDVRHRGASRNLTRYVTAVESCVFGEFDARLRCSSALNDAPSVSFIRSQISCRGRLTPLDLSEFSVRA